MIPIKANAPPKPRPAPPPRKPLRDPNTKQAVYMRKWRAKRKAANG